jgi:hypothetical protein
MPRVEKRATGELQHVVAASFSSALTAFLMDVLLFSILGSIKVSKF